MTQKVYLNDTIIDATKAAISIADTGLLYGSGLFETMRSYNTKVFALDDHLDRLFNSIKTLNIHNTYDRQTITDAIYSLLQCNALDNARIRLTLTSGPLSSDTENPQPTLLITATALTPYPKQYYDKGIVATLCQYRQNPHDPLSAHKTLCYFSRILALKTAHQKGGAESLWFTTDGRLAEGCISSVFLIKDSQLLTSTLDTPILPGITRNIICRLAKQNSIPLLEKDSSIDDTLSADEMFITNSIMEVMSVSCLEKHTYNEGKVGKITKQISQLYKKEIENECGIQNES